MDCSVVSVGCSVAEMSSSLWSEKSVPPREKPLRLVCDTVVVKYTRNAIRYRSGSDLVHAVDFWSESDSTGRAYC